MMTKKRFCPLFRSIASLVISAFLITTVVPPSYAQAQAVLNLPVPGTMVSVSTEYIPALIKGINLYPDDPLKFDFIIDRGESNLDEEAFQQESKKLIKYFMASLTTPEDQMWVNLSPYEKNRIIPEGFGKTLMGRDLLAQDYMLKQLTASLTYPEDDLGDEFWTRVYEKVEKEYGNVDIPMNTFNKIWILPDEAEVYEHEKGVFVVNTHLKVMLEEDYLALDINKNSNRHGLGNVSASDLDVISGVSSDIVREILIPEIEREVNKGEMFANLRQIFSATILAKWYKQTLKDSLLGKVYVDKAKTAGVDYEDKEINQKIYERYVESFKKGAFNYIKEDYDPLSQEIVPKKYFSGGINADFAMLQTTQSRFSMEDQKLRNGSVVTVGFDQAMTSDSEKPEDENVEDRTAADQEKKDGVEPAEDKVGDGTAQDVSATDAERTEGDTTRNETDVETDANADTTTGENADTGEQAAEAQEEVKQGARRFFLRPKFLIGAGITITLLSLWIMAYNARNRLPDVSPGLPEKPERAPLVVNPLDSDTEILSPGVRTGSKQQQARAALSELAAQIRSRLITQNWTGASDINDLTAAINAVFDESGNVKVVPGEISDSLWVVVSDPLKQSLKINATAFLELSLAEQEAILAREISRLTNTQRGRQQLSLDLFRKIVKSQGLLAEEDTPLFADSDEGRGLRSDFKRSIALEVQNEVEAYLVELNYHRRLAQQQTGGDVQQYFTNLIANTKLEGLKARYQRLAAIASGAQTEDQLRLDFFNQVTKKNDNRIEVDRILSMELGASATDSAKDQWFLGWLKDPANYEVSENDKAMTAQNLGGIDLNPNELKLKVENNGFALQISPSLDQLRSFKEVDGFTPVILNVTPVTSLPLILGLTEPEGEQGANDDTAKNAHFSEQLLLAKDQEELSEMLS